MKKRSVHILLLALLSFCTLSSLHATIRYVKEGGVGDGTSWADASGDLQAMINASTGGDQVWVAAGTYKPTAGTDRTISFAMKNGVAIYGGFPNTGNPGMGDREWATYVTTLSGDIGTVGNNSGNSYHVINNNDLDGTAVLDGFIVTGGEAYGGSLNHRGGGMYNYSSSPTVTNCIFSGNSATDGGGMYNNASSPTVTNCIFSGNSANSGGGMFNVYSLPIVTNCIFSGNSADYGGGMYNLHFPVLIVANCIFSGNSAITDGGGMFNFNASPKVTNCSFSGNSTYGHGGGMFNESSMPMVTNCILWGNSSGIYNYNSSNPTVTYSIVQGGYWGSGNLNVDPLFVSAGDLHLQTCSPAIDAGNNAGYNAAVPPDVTTDLDGNPRKVNATGSLTIDMGAYEYQSSYDVCTTCRTSGNIVYVNDAADGANNGKTWTDAFTSLQSALSLANQCPNVTEIWVAAGTYKPTTGGDRGISFALKNGVAIYGGFPNTGNPGMGDRDWATYVTTLSGDIGSVGNNSDNSYHIINNSGLNGTAVLDGFTITGGYADGRSPDDHGGGMYNDSSSPTVANCSFSDNSADYGGGGMANYSSSPTVTNCSFSGNSLLIGHGGGGMANYSSSPTVTNCSFSGNSVRENGGAMYNYYSSPTVTNCIFSGNSARWGGGGMSNEFSSPTVTNCIFSGNLKVINGVGAGMDNYFSSPTVTNCIFWGNSSEIYNDSSNPTVTYSIVQGGYPGTGNLNVDPLFVSQPPIGLGTSGDLHLQACSPAIDAGNNAANSTTTDLDGNPRKVNATGSLTIDMGAYEYQSSYDVCTTCRTSGNIVYVNDDAGGANNGKTWTDAFISLQSALALADQCPNVTEIWVATGTYTPTTGGDRGISFALKNGVAIYGGFPNTGNPGMGDRDWATYVTTLSGDIGTVGSDADNSYHVISNSGLNNTAVLDGFTVTGGNANGDNYPHSDGGGMNNYSSSPTVTNCSFSGNSAYDGGGIFNEYSSPQVTDCSFSGNSATYGGGGMFNYLYSSPTVTDCSFSGNSATDGGGMFNGSSSPMVTNCIFSGNLATAGGGGIYNNYYSSPAVTGCSFSGNSAPNGGGMSNVYSSPTVTNCIFSFNSATTGGGMSNYLYSSPTATGCSFSGNSAPNGGGMYNYYSSPHVTNCILWGNSSGIYNAGGSTSTVTYAIVQGGYPGTGNLNMDPLFVSTGDLHLQACSPAIDAGNSAAVPPGVTTDLGGNPRFYNGGTVDMGAYEFQGLPIPVLAVCQNQTVVLNALGAGTLSAPALDNGSSGCGDLDFTVDGSASLSFTCADIGLHTLILTVTDNRKQTATCNATVMVADKTPPSIACPGPVTVTCASQAPPVNLAAVTASDNCGTPTKSYVGDVTTNQTCANRKTITRTYKATDGSTNSNTCAQVITVFDNVQPVFTAVPANVTVVCPNPLPAVGTPTATDGCGSAVTVTYNGQTRTDGNCTTNYTMTRQWTASDGCGNTKTATQKIMVLDLTAPVFISMPANVTVQCNAVPPVGNPTATDGCGGTVMIAYNGQTRTNGSCADSYTLTRQWTASDGCNTRTATQKITVVDTQKPAFTFVPAPVTIECSDPVPPLGSPTATDNCAATVTITLLGQYTTGAPAPNAYLLVRVWKATDNCGNNVTASQVITVQDTQKPVFTNVPPSITIECSDLFPVTPGTTTATDNCAASVQVSYNGQTCAPGNCPQNYVVTRTWTAYDDYGNTQLATQTITVVDTRAPVFINPPANVTIACGAGIPPVPVVTASDACDNSAPVTYLGEVNTGPNCPYTVTRTWTVADDCGNAATYTQIITVSGQTVGGGGSGLKPATLNPELQKDPRADAARQTGAPHNPQPITLQLAPNPAEDEVWASFDATADGDVSIFLLSLDGCLVVQQQFPAFAGANRLRLDLSGMAAGVYVVRLNAGGQMAAERLVVFRD